MARNWFCGFVLILFLTVTSFAFGEPQSVTSGFSLGDRISCQTAIEQVYWRHRQWPSENGASKPSFEEAVPSDRIRQKAEDAILESLALDRFWGVTVTGAQLQAELERIAAHSQAPDVLRELLATVGNDPQAATECLARPLLVDRLIRSYYSHDERYHGNLKMHARAELASAPTAAAMRGTGARYREMEWQRRDAAPSAGTPAALLLDPKVFDQLVVQLRKSLTSPVGDLPPGRMSALREDDNRFYAVAILEMNARHVRLASVEWPKTSFESWWQSTRSQLPMAIQAPTFDYSIPAVGGSNCRDDSWKPTQQLLDPRYFHTAVWTGSEMIVFGGMSSVGTYYNDGSRYSPATDSWTLIAAKGAPGARVEHVAVWTGKEMVVFGGTGDNTGGRYSPATDTWRPTSTVGAPVGQSSAVVAWTGKEMLLWGGYQGGISSTGARYNPVTNTWMAMAQSPLAGRAQHAAVWTGTEFIIWGGYNVFIGQMYGDGARYNPVANTWKSISSANAPNARYWHTAVWTGTEMIVWGGINYPNYDLSGGRYNPATNTWKATSLINPPSLRWMHAAVWTGKEMVVQCGTPANAVGGKYDPATDIWTSTNPVNAATNGQGITAVWTGKEMILWGGLDDDFLFHNDGGRYNPAADRWRRTTTLNVPSARGLHAAVWTGSEMIVWGGFDGGLPNSGGIYDPATDSWMPTAVAGAPVGRENAEAVWTGTEAIFWGGWPDGFNEGTGGRYNPATGIWTPTSLVNAPFNRYGHTAMWTGDEMIVFGGVGTDNVAKRYHPANDTWTDATAVNAPGARDHHGAVWTGTVIIIWGGFINDGSKPTGGRYNPATDTWRPTNVTSSPATRMWPVSVWSGTEAIFWGGLDGTFDFEYDDGGRYNPVTDSWTKTSSQNTPSPRVAQGVWTGKEMLLWGGANDSSGGRYNPASDSWKKTTLVNAAPVRWGGRWSTVWTGEQMIVWGGIIETQQGSLYCASGQPNVAPSAADDSYSVTAGKLLVVGPKIGVLVNDSDGNGDVLAAGTVSKPVHGAFQFFSNGAFGYKPAAGFAGTDTFTYKANDGLANSNTATVTISVQ